MVNPVPVASPRRQRSDAVRNRAALLAAAREVLTGGQPSDVRSIAARAGVGVGTLFRHFATRDDLVDAVLAHDLELWREAAHAAVAGATGPYERLAAFLRIALERQIATPGLPRVYLDRWGPAAMDRVGPWYDALVRCLVEDALAAGEVRADLTPSDVSALVVATGHIALAQPEQALRVLAIALDGLRP